MSLNLVILDISSDPLLSVISFLKENSALEIRPDIYLIDMGYEKIEVNIFSKGLKDGLPQAHVYSLSVYEGNTVGLQSEVSKLCALNLKTELLSLSSSL